MSQGGEAVAGRGGSAVARSIAGGLDRQVARCHSLERTLLVACAGTALGQKHAPSLSGCHALTGVTVVTRPGQRVENVTLVVRDGLVQDVGIDVPAPADAGPSPALLRRAVNSAVASVSH